MRRRNAARCLLAASLVALAAGQDDDPNHGVVFIYPTKDQIYNLMDTVNVTYTSPFPTPNLYTFCDGGGRQVSMQRVPGYNATVPMILNFTSATPCWFNLRPGTLPGFGANSEVFTIIGQERGSGSRVFGPSETPTVTPPPFTTSASGSRPTQTDPVTSQTGAGGSTNGNVSSNDNGTAGPLSGAASAGIGVGVAVGVLALAGGVFAWWWKRRGKTSQGGAEVMQGHGDDKPHNVPPSGSGYTPSAASAYSPVPRYQELNTLNGPAEIASSEGGRDKHEMPA